MLFFKKKEGGEKEKEKKKEGKKKRKGLQGSHHGCEREGGASARLSFPTLERTPRARGRSVQKVITTLQD